MRRKEREITSHCEIVELIEKCDVCRLGLSQNNIPYIVPMSFGYEFINEQLILYFHGAGEGKKHAIMKDNPNACFEMDHPLRVIKGETACQYSREYESIIGQGQISICLELEEKQNAALLLMKKNAPEKTFSFTEKELSYITVFKLCVTSYMGKRNLRN